VGFYEKISPKSYKLLFPPHASDWSKPRPDNQLGTTFYISSPLNFTKKIQISLSLHSTAVPLQHNPVQKESLSNSPASFLLPRPESILLKGLVNQTTISHIQSLFNLIYIVCSKGIPKHSLVFSAPRFFISHLHHRV
jgi:hypothetical protein